MTDRPNHEDNQNKFNSTLPELLERITHQKMTSYPDTPEVDELSDIVNMLVIANIGREHPNLKSVKEAKASLTRLLAKRELEGRIAALEAVKKLEYPTENDYIVQLSEVDGVLGMLREELAKYE